MTEIAYVGATLIDGTGVSPQPNAAICVAGGRITWVGSASELGDRDGRQVVDFTGKFVIPGLMDGNAHTMLHLDPDVVLRYEPGHYDDLVLEASQVSLREGVTTVFDTWGPVAVRRVRDRVSSGETLGARIFCAGNIIGNAGPWSRDFDFFTAWPSLSSVVVDRVNEEWEQGVGGDLPWMAATDVRLAVREYITRSDIDFVKYASSAHGPKKFIAFSPDSQRAIVEEAHAAGLTAQACAMTPEALTMAIDAGVDVLQHGNVTSLYPMPKETVELIAERQLPCAVLLFTERYRKASAGDVRNGEFTREDERMEIAMENAADLVKARAKLVAATDGGVFGATVKTSPFWGAILSDYPEPPYLLGSASRLWLQAAAECGMTPMDALVASTRNVADAYGQLDDLGTVEVGKYADFVVLQSDPLKDVKSYGDIVHVVKDGQIVDREALPTNPVLTADE